MHPTPENDGMSVCKGQSCHADVWPETVNHVRSRLRHRHAQGREADSPLSKENTSKSSRVQR